MYDEESSLDPWLTDVRWFWKYHAAVEPTWSKGKILRGYAKFTSYQFAAEAYDRSLRSTFEWDIVAHYSYENLAGGEYGGCLTNALAALRGAGSKMITGYPSGLYGYNHPDANKMHVTGPFSEALQVERGAYLMIDGVTAGSGNSGGPVWVQDKPGTWSLAGVVVAASDKALGATINRVGVRAMDADAWALVTEAIGAAPPANDNFATSTTITKVDYTTTGSNVGATKEADEPDHADESGGKSVWWAWTSPVSGTITVDTTGSSFDTLLGIYTGNSVTNLTPIASDDEGGGQGTSKVTFTAVQGTLYHVTVDGLGMASGSIMLNFVSAPPNDDFTARALLTGPSPRATGSNVSASKEAGEPNHAGLSGGKSVWWTWQTPTNGMVTLDTFGSSFDTLLAVYTGDSVSKLTLIAGNNDGAQTA